MDQPGAAELDDQLFDRLWDNASGVPGWLSKREAKLLFVAARNNFHRGRVVELGSYCGRSAIFLAGSLSGTNADQLICVDTFAGSPEHQLGQPKFDQRFYLDGRVDTFDAFQGTCKAAGLLDRADAWRMTTLDAAKAFDGDVSVLFVDADHAYDAVSADLAAWLPQMVSGGIVILHDVGRWEGPTRAAADLLGQGFRFHAQADTALAVSKP